MAAAVHGHSSRLELGSTVRLAPDRALLHPVHGTADQVEAVTAAVTAAAEAMALSERGSVVLTGKRAVPLMDVSSLSLP